MDAFAASRFSEGGGHRHERCVFFGVSVSWWVVPGHRHEDMSVARFWVFFGAVSLVFGVRPPRSGGVPRMLLQILRVVSRARQRRVVASGVSRLVRVSSSASAASRMRARFRAARGLAVLKWNSARRSCMRSMRWRRCWKSSDSKMSRMVSSGRLRSWAMSRGSDSGSRSAFVISMRVWGGRASWVWGEGVGGVGGSGARGGGIEG